MFVVAPGGSARHCGLVHRQSEFDPVGSHKQIPFQLLAGGQASSNTCQVGPSVRPEWVVCVVGGSSDRQWGFAQGSINIWHIDCK